MLSDRQIRALKPLGKDKMLSDGGGLYVRISKHGTKTFLYRTREGGRARYVTLGTYPELSLSDAREKTGELQGKAVGIVTVQSAVDEYLKQCPYEHPEQVEQRLFKNITPLLGKRRLDSITSKDITDALRVITDRGSPVSANRTLADVKHVFSFAYEKGWVRQDPSARITRKVVGGREKTRDTVLTEDEVKHLIKELRSDRWEIKTRVGIALCLITGQRASECLGITQDEIKEGWWFIPTNRTKSKRAQKVYLVPFARYLSRYAEQCDHRTLSRALNRAGMRYTPHDLRRLMSTVMNDQLGIMPHVVEKCLNHSLEGVMAVYNRAEYAMERREAWERWYCYLRRIASSI